MDAVSYSLASKQAQRIERFIEDPDSTSGIVTVPKTIASGETVTVPAGRIAVLPNIVVDGTLNIDGEVFIPSGSSVDFSNGIKIDGNNIVLSIPTAYHIYNGSVEATNTVVTNGFSTTLYTGNGGTQSINTGVDMSTQWGNDVSETFGGLVWLKSRSTTDYNLLHDTVRGVGYYLSTNTTSIPLSGTTQITSLSNNGFNTGGAFTSGINMVSWNFQTTHRRTGVTNHGKAYTEHYNPFTGFTIIKYEGSGIAGHEIPHSLGRKLGFWLNKNLLITSAWNAQYRENYNMLLNDTPGEGLDTNKGFKNSDKNLTLGTNNLVNTSTQSYIMYGWTNSYYDVDNTLIGNYEVGVYQGTGVAGNKVTTRGKPAWIMIKRLDSTGNWNIYNNQVTDGRLIANLSNAESTYDATDFVSDGFILKSVVDSEHNISGGQFLYMVVYDNDSGSGKSKYPKATDTTNLSINALVPYANGIDVNGEKVSISYKNETITGLTLTQGKNYPYSKNDGTYGLNKYEPMYGKLRDRVTAGENPDYFDLETRKWYGTSGGVELITNGDGSSIVGWSSNNTTISIADGLIVSTNTATNGFIYQYKTTVIGRKYRLKLTSLSGNATPTIQIRENDFNGAVIYTDSGFKVYDIIFTANTTTTAFVFVGVGASGTITRYDDISVFEATPTIGAEITPRTYLDCIVYADQNGQVEYVEELPKIEYVDIIKANEYQGKNACTARADVGGTPLQLISPYNFSAVVLVSAGIFDLYFSTPMDNLSYDVEVSLNVLLSALAGTSLPQIAVASKDLNKVQIRTVNYTGSTNTVYFNSYSFNISIHGGKN